MPNILRIKKRKTIAALVVSIASMLSILILTMSPLSASVSAVTFDSGPEYSNGLDIDPLYMKFDLNPGEIYRGSISITNTNSKPITIKAYIKPYTIGGSDGSDGYSNVDFETKTSESEIVDWTSVLAIGNSEMTLDAGQTRSLNFVIDSPDDAKDGDQYEVIFIEPIEPNDYGNTNRTGITIIANVIRPFPIHLIIEGIIIVVVIIIALITAILLHHIRKKKHALRKKEAKSEHRQ